MKRGSECEHKDQNLTTRSHHVHRAHAEPGTTLRMYAKKIVRIPCPWSCAYALVYQNTQILNRAF